MAKIFSDLFKSRYFFAMLLLACIIVYYNSLLCDFVYDDKLIIMDNAYIKDFRFLKKIFSADLFNNGFENSETNYYRPLHALSLMLDYRLWGLNPFGYHLTNVFLHYLNSLLIYFIVYLLFDNLFIAVVSSLLFCIHPVNITAVTYISGRADILAGLFILSGILNFILILKNGKKKAQNILLFVVLFSLAFLSRENALAAPLIIAMLYLFLKGKSREKLLLVLCVSLIALLYAIIRVKIINLPLSEGKHFSQPVFLQFIMYAHAVMYYLWFLIFPYKPHLFRNINLITSLADIRILSALIFLCLCALIYIRRKNKILLFGALWFLLWLIPAFFVMPKFATDRLFFCCEHWLYLSSAGFYIIIGLLFYNCRKRKVRYINFVLAVIFAVLASITISYSGKFHDDLTVSEYLLEFNPYNVDSLRLAASGYLEKKEYAKAIKYIDLSLKLDPGNLELYIFKGGYLEKTGDIDKASHIYAQALKINPPALPKNYNYLGIICFHKNDFAAAESYFKKAIELNPRFHEAYINLAKMNYKNNKIEEAIYFNRQALILNPYNKDYFLNLARLYSEKKQFKEVVEILNNALAYNHKDALVLLQLAVAKDELGFTEEASGYILSAYKKAPQSEEVLLNLGIFYAKQGQLVKAVQIWQEALKVNPGNKEVNENILKAKELLNNK